MDTDMGRSGATTDDELDRIVREMASDLRRRRREQDEERRATRMLWLSHHWPDSYQPRCISVGRLHMCRRCTALYPLGFAVAVVSALGSPPWPGSWDPTAIWLLSMPATVAFVGEALGWFRYSIRWQVGTTLLAGLAFGRALGYELVERWSSEFWGPIAVFGGIWFFASVAASRRRTVSDDAATGGQ
jgi:hypothetical protein